ncbi:hypothetical protein F901_00082 [Acinetobacter dispersus]|uniref:toll/interleukin-1 receptor domain-containing protein n=1 Tax=Acinetobacter dispersus TaxID=70348 RepID=UPI0002CDEDCA|nr:toll/interleukin-1 receptor domain-containing protein [Acinetobacter dispersus]ENX56757.1 hypothetical protein F901_00082 [Acinetobacter dispersus]
MEKNNNILYDLEKYLLIKDNVFCATEIQKHLFPETSAEIFLSHAHVDEDKVIALAVHLEDLGFNVFVDSCVWGNAFTLLRKIDKKYCKYIDSDTGKEFHSYKNRNFSTANIYMILNAALHKMIDRFELFIFLGTENSMTIEESIEKQQKIISPWIFSELTFVNQVRRYDKRYDMRSKQITESASVSLENNMAMDREFSFHYSKPCLDFTLSNQQFENWLLDEISFDIVSENRDFDHCERHIQSLERLYEIMRKYGESREDRLYQQRLFL